MSINLSYQLPPCDEVSGILIHKEGSPDATLLLGITRIFMIDCLLHQTKHYLRYAFRYLYEANSLFPQFAYDDHRREYHGMATLKFLLDKGTSFPRGDVVGMRLSDRQCDELFIKQLDIAGGLEVYAFDSMMVSSPLGRIETVVCVSKSVTHWAPLPEDSHCLPILLQRAVPGFFLPATQLDRLDEYLHKISNL